MSVLVPPRRSRLRFWALGLRLPVEYRPWVYQQITEPGYYRKRMRALLGLQLVCYVFPQMGLALAAHSLIRLAIPLLVVVAFGVAVARGRSMSSPMRQQLFAYHGVTVDGSLIEPVSPWAHNPLGRVGLALFCAQLLLFTSGVVIAADRISARHHCKPVSVATRSAVAADIGVPRPGGALPFDIPGLPHDRPIPGVVPGGPLLHARQIATPFAGIHYVAAYVRNDSGRLIGPAVWQVVDPYATFALPTRQISAGDATARVLTPSLGFSYGGKPDPLIAKAKDCARAAR